MLWAARRGSAQELAVAAAGRERLVEGGVRGLDVGGRAAVLAPARPSASQAASTSARQAQSRRRSDRRSARGSRRSRSS